MKKLLYVFILILIFSCNKEKGKEKQPVQETNLPEASSYPLAYNYGPEANAFISHCQTCHTLRYIEMQPKLSKKQWEKTVEKMIHSYGAPIDSIAAKEIVDYISE